MEWYHLYLILGVVIAIIVTAFILIRKRVRKRMDEQESMVNQHKITTTILVLEKRKDKVANSNIPKSIVEKIPRLYKIRKMPIVKAKIGPQIMDLMCEEKVYDQLPERKSVKVELAGIFIAGIKKGKK